MACVDGDLKARVWPFDVTGKGLYVGLFEHEEVQFIRRILKPGMVFLDIGANMGFYSIIAAKYVGSSGQVHSFEPSPRMFEELKFNIELNGLSNVEPNSIALGDKSGTACLSRYERGKEVYASLSPNVYPGAKITGHDYVTVETLDNYVEEKRLERVDVIKIDVEGAECLVLRGSQVLLSSTSGPTIILEMVPSLMEHFNCSCNEVVRFFREFGYKVFTLSDGIYEELSGDCWCSEMIGSNFVAIKKKE